MRRNKKVTRKGGWQVALLLFFGFVGLYPESKHTFYGQLCSQSMPVLSVLAEEKERSILVYECLMDCLPNYEFFSEQSEGTWDENFEKENQMALEKIIQQESALADAEESGEKAEEEDSYASYQSLQPEYIAANQTDAYFRYAIEKQVELDAEKIYDASHLIQNYYHVDATTNVKKGMLQGKKLLKQSMELGEETIGEPQILIYHTHSQEGFLDSRAGNANDTVVGVGEYLKQLLENRYGLSVLHHTGIYDTDRDRAYTYAAPALEQILEQHDSIEVVIDLHRDGVPESTRLVTTQNDTKMAQIMFFNGLSRTTADGDLESLANPNLSTNLAFSLQMKLMADTYYPGFARDIYLKGMRYNMHYCPKTLLVEVGAQNSTLEEAMNAMPPLADILNRVLTGEKVCY